jgi:glyoxylase-like metal-dependent hydrolase (beta-lactamase superfamily II)
MLDDPAANLSGLFGMPVYAPAAGQLVRPGDRLMQGPLEWVVLDTAGHTPGGVSYHCPSAHLAIVGDALFAGGIGRYDLPGSDGELLLANIRRNLLTLADSTRILSGHGPQTTIGEERRTNPFLQGPA